MYNGSQLVLILFNRRSQHFIRHGYHIFALKEDSLCVYKGESKVNPFLFQLSQQLLVLTVRGLLTQNMKIIYMIF